jgi:hypothetical protein
MLRSRASEAAVAITGVRWLNEAGFDIHVLEGGISQHLDSRVEVLLDGVWLTRQPLDPDDPSSPKLPSSVTFRFVAEVAASPASLGLTISDALGSVAVTKPRPAHPFRVDNFLLRVEVFEGTSKFATTPRLRVHVHETLDGLWLAPRQLTLRAGASPQYFSVLALFGDGTIGDLTYSPDLRWSKGPSDTVTLDPLSGALKGASSGHKGTITVKLPSWGGVTASAPVTTGVSWKALGESTAARFLGGPGKDVAGKVPNILLLPDGFDDTGKGAFEVLVTEVVRRLGSDGAASPFDLLLRKAVNLWSAWIPSTDKGVTVGSELAVNSRQGKLMGDALPDATPPSSAKPPDKWRVDELIFKVGLPLPADLIDQDDTDDALKPDFQRRSERWLKVFGVGGVTLDQYKQWADLADRGIANDRDSGLGLTFGGRPNHEARVPEQRMQLHPLRTTRDDLDPFLEALQGPGGLEIGKLAWGKTGKDRERVYTLVAAIRHGGTHSSDLSASSLSQEAEVAVKPAAQGGRSLDLVDPPMPRAPSLKSLLTLVHEMSHGFHLGDEYGQRGVIPDAELAKEAGSFNLQGRAELLDGGQLSGANLKWLWPRMTKVTYTTGPVLPAGGNRLKVKRQPFPAGQPGYGAGEVVQMRLRALGPGLVPSAPWRVFDDDVATNQLTIEPIGTGPTVPLLFPIGSLLFAPALDPAAPPGTPKPLLLVHDKIRVHITTTHQPLNAPKGAPPSRPCSDGPEDEPVQQPNNRPDGLAIPPGAFWAWVVGAYEGGRKYRCGVYHPAGACAMRDAHITVKRVGDKYVEGIITLCAVCRYALVDQLDPTQHGRVDDWLTSRYPK